VKYPSYNWTNHINIGTLILNSIGGSAMMRKLCLFLIFILAINPAARSTHIYGGELLYEHISGNLYRMKLYLYGDCGTPNPQYLTDLMSSTAQVQIYDEATGTQEAMMYLPVDAGLSDIDVTPVCPAYINQTKCVSLSGSIPGIKRYVFHDTITLSHVSDQWRFTFTGFFSGSGGQAGRTNSITNLDFSTGSLIMYLVARLNNTTAPNSSPIYNTVPTPFYCINVLQQYNQGATDPNNDSLTFQLVPALTDNFPVGYLSPYTPTNPMSASLFSFDNINGQMTFQPDVLQRPLIVNEVREYKNGVFVGSSMREMTFIILDNCQNQAPDGDLFTTGTGLTGGINQGNNVINVCTGTPLVSFSWLPVDPNAGDSVTLTTFNLPPGANLTINNNNTPTPSADFSWDLTGVPNGIYTFYVNYRDNGCPLNTNQTLAYTIQIANPYSITAHTISPTNCAHQAGVQINTSGGVLPRTITISNGSGIIKTLTDTSGTIMDSLYAGTYTLNVYSNYFSCSASTVITVTDSGYYPFPPNVADVGVCQGASPVSLNVTTAPGGVLQWYTTEGNQLPGAPTYNTDITTTYTWLVNQVINNVCLSDTVPAKVVINSNPVVTIPNMPGRICYADRVYLEATGAQNYQWLPENRFATDEEGRQYAMITEAITFTVIGFDNNVCKDTAIITYNDIEQCCNFAYPNAFTPNNDGKNERFRPVMYGNMEEYELSIYNRFGERIYQGKDQRSGWDGKYKGQLCDVGMYFFKVKAKCYTGQKEENNGVVYLLR
jgi:gliding motility-associated-like protein